MYLTDTFLQNIEGSKIEFGKLAPELDIAIDSRTIKPGQIFLALIGARVDGHDFLQDALNNGASALIIQENKKNLISTLVLTDQLVVTVPDTLAALIAMAKVVRKQFTGIVVGITGSVGKTTTKEMLNSILKKAGCKSYVSKGNQNSDIGLSLNVIKLRNCYTHAVFELGINEIGEMSVLVDIARPSIAAITSITPAHMEGLGSIEGVAREKSLIFSYFDQNGVAIIPDNLFIPDPLYRVVRFGEDGDVYADAIISRIGGISFVFHLFDQEKKVFLKNENRTFVSNALVAGILAYYMGLSLDEIVLGLEDFSAVEGRFKRKKISNSCEIIDDCYNASPESMKASIKTFEELPALGGPKIAVLGDMLELGQLSEFWHTKLGEILNKTNIEYIILVGKHSKIVEGMLLGKTVIYTEDWQKAQAELAKIIKPKSFILFKASNGIGLKNIVVSLV